MAVDQTRVQRLALFALLADAEREAVAAKLEERIAAPARTRSTLARVVQPSRARGPIEAGTDMDRRVINPWTWQGALGSAQGLEVSRSERILHCARPDVGPENGAPVHPGDMVAQARPRRMPAREHAARRPAPGVPRVDAQIEATALKWVTRCRRFRPRFPPRTAPDTMVRFLRPSGRHRCVSTATRS
jgi:hypothetical protein